MLAKWQRQIKIGLPVILVTLCSALVVALTQGASTPTPAVADPATTFTIAQIPDTQNEVLSDNPLLASRYQWLSDNKAALNLQYIAHTGDLVNWGVADPVQFTRANSATNILDASGVPYGYAVGNHDTAAVTVGGSAAPGNTHDNLRDTTAFNQNFPITRFKNVGGSFEPNKMDNMYQIFSAGGKDWLVLTLEMWPRQAAVDWAKQIVATHPHHNVIVTTHAYVDNAASRPTTGNYGDLNAQVVWQQLISQYSNIKMTLSAHYGPVNGVGGYSYNEVTGVNGNKIAQIMTAYHASYQNHVRLLQIDAANGTINSSVYVHTSTHPAYPSGYITDGASNFATTGMNWIEPETTTPPVQTVPSAPTAVTATAAGSGKAIVSFTPPSSDGGATITDYTVTASPGGITAAGGGSPITVNGLTNGTAYTFTVKATNSVGTGPESTPSNSVTPQAQVELLPDAGFESGNGGWIAFVVGNLTRVTSPVRSGNYAMKISATSSTTNLVGMTQNNVISNSVAGKQYTALCYARPTAANLKVQIRFLEYTQNYSSNINIGNTTIQSLPTNTWTQVKVTGTATASGKRIIPQIYSSNQTTNTGSIIYDDCSVTSN